MRKYIIMLLCVGCAIMGLIAQSVTSLDVEYQLICMMDSISPLNEVEFARKYYVNKGTYQDLNSGLTAAYTIQGTAIPCFGLTGTSECWLVNVQRPRNTYSYAVNTGVGIESSDYSLIALKMSDHLGNQFKKQRNDFTIPINYPYRNTQHEADRLENDLMDYFECKRICIYGISVVVGLRSLEPSITIVEKSMLSAVYSTNLVTPFPDSSYYFDNAVLVTGANTSCTGIAEVFRKELNGAILYYIDELGVVNAPPLPVISKRVACNYLIESVDDCDRIGTSQCMIAPSDNEVCSYFLQINHLDTIFGLYINGVDVVTPNIHPNLGTHHHNVTTKAQEYIDTSWSFGIFSTNDLLREANEGWIFQLNYSEATFDSVVTNRGTYYPKKSDCRNFHFYNVTKNELGGVVSVTDELGQYLFAPPDRARIVSCDQISTDDIDCEVEGSWGTEHITSTTVNFDLKDYWSFSYYVEATPVQLTTTKKDGSTEVIQLSQGYAEGMTSPNACEYFNTKNLEFQVTGSGKLKVSYQW